MGVGASVARRLIGIRCRKNFARAFHEALASALQVLEPGPLLNDARRPVDELSGEKHQKSATRTKAIFGFVSS
jgi:hypothetical protein